MLELFVLREDRCEDLIEECVNCCKHGAHDEELEYKERALVNKEDEDANLTNAAVLRSFATDHLDKITQHLACAKEGTIHPSSPLLHQDHH